MCAPTRINLFDGQVLQVLTFSVVLHGKVQNYGLEMPDQILKNGEQTCL